MPHYKSIGYSSLELITDNSKIGAWSRDLLDGQLKYRFSFFLGLSATIPSPVHTNYTLTLYPE
jgi:hypothetical protein